MLGLLAEIHLRCLLAWIQVWIRQSRLAACLRIALMTSVSSHPRATGIALPRRILLTIIGSDVGDRSTWVVLTTERLESTGLKSVL
jgi:hypothetical protein